MDLVRPAAETWFPGQMARTRRLIRENLRLVGVVIEVADARAPRASRYPALAKLCPGRPILTVLTKADLAEPRLTAEWVSRLPALSFSESQSRDARAVVAQALALGGRSGGSPAASARATRAMVVGLPNVGKSTLINRLVGRASARTGDRPGITTGKQWLKAGGRLDLLDLPGILVPGRLPPKVALTLALLGNLPSQAFDPNEVALHALARLEEAGRLPDGLADGRPPRGAGPADEPGRYQSMLADYAIRRGHLKAGGQPDTERAAVAMIGALRDGRFGPLTLERPEEAP